MKWILLLLSLVSLSACYSYRIYPNEYQSFAPTEKPKKAYVLNNDLIKEYKILEYSKIYEMTNDSTIALKIRLYPIRRNPLCGEPIIASWITLGQIPVSFPDTYRFRFEEIVNEKIKFNQFDLKISKRVWFWDFLVFGKKFEQKAGKLLSTNYHNHNHN
jgi:hypothetical protein